MADADFDVPVGKPRPGTLHILKRGHAMCGTMSYPPSTWPMGHWWVGATEWQNWKLSLGQKMCTKCVKAFEQHGED